ncbi:sugar ABC transporter ATP-binding protein [Polaromonas hydrogenivorans]|uniref:Sugar ABC transporter ATP-binding protein n=1 Tax=Polaromonas hydrogenivorans TaxID=335476 RepID=A0AAU7LRF2_9BURK
MTCAAPFSPRSLDRGPLTVSNVRQHFGAVQALAGIDFSVAPGEVVGLVGHNGAGKSTLMHILAGTLQRDSGTLSISGEEISGRYDPCAANARGIRCVFQELSLCQNLDLVENTRIAHPGLRGFGWRKRAAQLIREQLDAVFPGHGMALDAVVGKLPIGQRQMAEIARAYTVTSEPLRFVILDEPTSSLGHHAARQALDFVAASARRGVAAILISHRLEDILRICGRVVVMVDGRIVANRPTEGLSRDGIVALMGHLQAEPRSRPEAIRAQPAAAPVRKLSGADSRDHPIEVYQGEIVGLAGLDGHGQRECLRRLHAASMKRRRSGPPVAYVAGDRQAEGLFPLWSITKNLSIGCLKALRRNALICAAAEASLAREWVATMGLKTAGIDLPVLSLSGGNQQKLLFARALASRAELVFLDDPLRGVDVGTKQSVYRHIRQEADKGRSFVWYTSEVGELTNCDRVYVFREQRVVAVLTGSAITEASIIDLSFRGRG